MSKREKKEDLLCPGRKAVHGKKGPSEKGHRGNHKARKHGLVRVGLDQHGHPYGKGGKNKTV
ncbi:MAG: hypothetical protein BAW33_08275 [Desulfobacterales bacterium C00003104]|nr:MAG: hypothetical protein BAW33_08275 [Desulfobacterales bacterium C00003104]